MERRLHVPIRRAALAALLLLLIPGSAAAADVGSIGGSPAYQQTGNDRSRGIFIFTLGANQSGSNAVKVTNYKDSVRTVVLDAVDSVLASDGSFSCRQNSEPKRDASLWLKLSQTQVTLQPKATVNVPFTVQLPASVSPGEHDACITLQDTQNVAGTSGSGLQLGFRIAIRVSITVPGDIVKQLEITGVNVSQKPNGDYLVAPVGRNAGNVSLDVTSYAQIDSIFKQQSPVQSATYPIMPKSSMHWGYTFKQPFWGGWYRVRTSMTYDSNTANGLGAADGSPKRIYYLSHLVFFRPKPQAAVIELAVLALLLLIPILLLKRAHRHRRIRRHWRPYTIPEGPTLTDVARAHGIGWKRLAKANGLRAPYVALPGQQLLVPVGKKARKAAAPAQPPAAASVVAVKPVTAAEPDQEVERPSLKPMNYDYVQKLHAKSAPQPPSKSKKE